MVPIEIFKLKDGKILEIHIDPDPINPRKEWDNLCYILCFHKRYDLGDTHHYKKSDYESWDEFKTKIEEDNPQCIIHPLYLMDHSGLSISIQPFGCPWDSGQIGFIFLPKEYIEQELKNNLKRAEQVISSEIESYNQYLSGEVYGYIIRDKNCSECGSAGEELDSCWGYFDRDSVLDNYRKEII